MLKLESTTKLTTMTKEFLQTRTIDGFDSSSSSDGGSSESSQSNDKSRKKSRSPSDDRREVQSYVAY